MKIALVQTKPNINDFEDNYKVILEFLDKALKGKADLICFPEMALCGYEIQGIREREISQKSYIMKLQQYSIDNKITICIGGIEKDNDLYYISHYVINNEIQRYRKTHVGKKESTVFSSGNDMPIFEIENVKFGIMTCYDGHFPELALKYALKGAKFILNPSAAPNLPSKRLNMWSKYLVARAYDNRVWVLATNLLFNGKGGGLITYDSNGDKVMSHSGENEYMEIVEVSFTDYSKTMRNRIFNEDRRVDLYGLNK